MRFLVWFTLLAFVALVILLPILFGQLLITSLEKLHLSAGAAVALVIAIVLGGLVNIPVRRIVREGSDAALDPFSAYRLPVPWQARATGPGVVIAVNLGGCVIPAGLALYELYHLAAQGGTAPFVALVAASLNCFVCYRLAQPAPGIGIIMPGLVPPLVAAAAALLLAPGDTAAPVAFIAGVAGPLIGADLLHLRDIGRVGAGMASIGGAGTFDGIVLSGIVAAYLA
ncbi:DUF1614 domain-containing protein [Desertibaculum subflavum]|uniref:DUF1614 domain-containing protein n=1 Tax=Desertibaculum subflavum TaxID=2268458 RepID=UPI000E66A2F7